MVQRKRDEPVADDRKGSARILDLLDALCDTDGPVALGQIARAVRLPKSTVHRLLGILQAGGYVEREPDTDRYGLGIRAFRLGAVALRNNSLLQVAHPYLKKLANQTGESVHLATRDDTRVLILDRVESDLQMIRAVSPVGARTPLHATGVGKALLATLPDFDLQDLFERLELRPLTARTITDPTVLLHELAEIRARGYAIDNGESLDEVRCVAVAIRDIRRRPVAVLSITAPAHRLPPERIPELAALACATAEGISLRYGGERD
jgi:IclR family acetate operon transcriptional repressor